jgi:hypothetical protein
MHHRQSILRRNERVFRHQRVWTDRGVNWSFARYEYPIVILLVCHLSNSYNMYSGYSRDYDGHLQIVLRLTCITET